MELDRDGIQLSAGAAEYLAAGLTENACLEVLKLRRSCFGDRD